jgi:hypothetical protein
LESAKCKQQYSDQCKVIFATVWAGASPTHNKATGIKISHFGVRIADNWNCLALKKTTEFFEHFDIQ